MQIFKKKEKVSITLKMIIIGTTIITASILLISTIAYLINYKALMNQSFNQLETIKEIKKKQIESYFENRLNQLKSYSKTVEVSNLYKKLSVYHDKKNTRYDQKYNVNSLEYQKIWFEDGKHLKNFINDFGYHDIFLICAKHGHVMFTVAKESDLGENLQYGKYKESGLALLWKEIIKTKEPAFIDFTPYQPSGGKPASFIGCPIFDTNKTMIGILAFQTSLKQINDIMQERSGMGKTGETYLVGTDKKMRSDSYLNPQTHSVVASFAGNILKNGVDTEGSRNALLGKTDKKIIIDYNGKKVLSAYTFIDIQNSRWALLAEKNLNEVEKPIIFMRNIIILVAIILIAISGYVLYILSNKTIIKPILHLQEISSFLAKGDLTHNVEINSNDEIGELSKDFNYFIQNIHTIIQQVQLGTYGLSTAVQQISRGNLDLSQRTSEQASSIEEIASTIEEANATIYQNNENSQLARKLSSNTTKLAEDGSIVLDEAISAINNIDKSSKKIEDITTLINEIAFQTNLLALNAAVEAARAGEQGRGFAVVAGEVRNLAQRSANAAKDIETLIKDSLEQIKKGTELSNKSGDAFSEILKSITKVSSIITEVATANEEQKLGMSQINISITEMDSMTQQNASLVEETASASEEMSSQAQELLALVERFKVTDNLKMKNINNFNYKNKSSVNKPNEHFIKQKNSSKKTLSSLMENDGFEEF